MAENQWAGPERRVVDDPEAYFNSQFAAEPHLVGPGQCHCTDDRDVMLVASVGAGVVLSIQDTDLGFGGLAYLMLQNEIINYFPNMQSMPRELQEKADAPFMECIGMMKRHGAAKGRLRIRMIGASNLPNDKNDMATKNYIYFKEKLIRMGIKIDSEDVGGAYVRRLHYFPRTGRAVRRILKRQSDIQTIVTQEDLYYGAFGA